MEMRKFLGVILAIQLAILGLVGLSALGFDTPVLRQVVGFIYLTFVPGLLLLRILRLNRLSTIETLLYSVGLSIAFVMFAGFIMNMLYPFIGISKPISILPVIATISVIVLILCAIVYKREIHEREPLPQSGSIPWSELFSPPVLFLLLLPALAVLGTFLVYFQQGNILSLIFLFLVGLAVILVAFNKFIPTKLYPLAIVAIGLGLLWQWSLISPDLLMSDTYYEYYAQKLTLANSIWDHTIPSNVNGMLSVTILAPTYSLILNLNTVWIFKIIYPLFFSLVPLALFQAYRKQIGDNIAFFGVFFLMSMPGFFWIGLMARQPIAELFLALSILLFLSKEMVATKRTLLLIVFGFSIVVSHYGLSYIYMFYLLLVLPLLLLQRLYVTRQPQELSIRSVHGSTLSSNYVMLFVVLTLAWYMYISSGSLLISITRIGGHIYSSLLTELFSPEAREALVLQALGGGSSPIGIRGWIFKAISHATQFFIVVGVVYLITNLRKMRFHPEYVAMVLVSLVILAMSIVVPYFASSLGIIRIYHIALIFLAPFCVLGGMAVFRWLFRVFSLHRPRILATSAQLSLVVTLVLAPYFLFNTGFIHELTGDEPTLMALSLYEADYDFLTQPEIRAREWLGNAGGNFVVYSDAYAAPHLFQEFGSRSIRLPFDAEQIPQGSYIFLRRWNIIHNELLLLKKVGSRLIPERINLESDSAFSDALGSRNKIYDSGWAQIYR
jgi:uncharacterized membrane protein